MNEPKRYKDEKFASLIVKYSAEYFENESNKNSLITVTKADILNRGRKAVVYFTVFPNNEETKALEFAKRKRNDFRSFVVSKKSFGFVPSFDFEIDYGERTDKK